MRWFDSRRKTRAANVVLTRELRKANQLTAGLQRQMAHAAEYRFPDSNLSYERGWLDCLKFLNIPIREDQGHTRNLPAIKARQSRITHRTDGNANS